MNSKKAFFKIIVPNYNNMPYIKKCLDSILQQTFKDFFVIVVDDMSTDCSDKFCEAYERIYPDKIKLLRLEKKGYAGTARNVGINYNNIISEYTWFIDGDDWLYSNTVLQQLYDNIIKEKHDVYFIDYALYINENIKIYKNEFNLDKKILVTSNCRGSPFKLIKSSIVPLFLENCIFGEDIYQFLLLLNTTNDYKLLHIVSYVVNINNNSTTKNTKNDGKGALRQQHKKIFVDALRKLKQSISKDILIDAINYRLNIDNNQKNNKKILLISAATKNLEWQYNETNKIKAEYCKLYDYTFKFISLNDNIGKKSYYARQKLILDNLNSYEYDYVIWMDVDAWINNFSISFDNIIDNFSKTNTALICAADHDIRSPKDYLGAYINSGVLIFKTCKEAQEIIKLWMTPSDDIIAWKNMFTRLNDQPYLSVRILFDSFVNAHTIRVTSDILNWFIWEQNTNSNKFILHAAGVNLAPNRKQIFLEEVQKTKNRNKIQ